MNGVAKKVALSSIKARILCAGGGSRGFNTKYADEHQIFYDKVNWSFKLDSEREKSYDYLLRSLLPAQLSCKAGTRSFSTRGYSKENLKFQQYSQLNKNIAGNLKTGVKSRFSPIWNQLSESDPAQLSCKRSFSTGGYFQRYSQLLVTCCSPTITRMCSSGGGGNPSGTPSFNTLVSAERIAFYNKVKTRCIIDPREAEYLNYLLDPSPKPEDKLTSAYVHNLARKCLIGTEASLLPGWIENLHATEFVMWKARPDLITRAKKAIEYRVPYIFDPGWIKEFDKDIASRKTPTGDYTKFLAAKLLVTHVSGDSGGHHRFIDFVSGWDATAIDYYPPEE